MFDHKARIATAILDDAMRGFAVSDDAKNRAATVLAGHFAAIDFGTLWDPETATQLVNAYVDKREREKASSRHIGEELAVFGEVLAFFALSRPEYEELATHMLRNWSDATVAVVAARTKDERSA